MFRKIRNMLHLATLLNGRCADANSSRLGPSRPPQPGSLLEVDEPLENHLLDDYTKKTALLGRPQAASFRRVSGRQKQNKNNRTSNFGISSTSSTRKKKQEKAEKSRGTRRSGATSFLDYFSGSGSEGEHEKDSDTRSTRRTTRKEIKKHKREGQHLADAIEYRDKYLKYDLQK